MLLSGGSTQPLQLDKISSRVTDGGSWLSWKLPSVPRTPGSIQKVDPLMGVPIKYP